MMQVDVENDDTVDIVFEMRVDGTDGYIVHKAEPGRCILARIETVVVHHQCQRSLTSPQWCPGGRMATNA